jgi:hypothetical protein
MNTLLPPFAKLGEAPMGEPAIAGPEAETPLDFLGAIYRDPMQPISLRLRAAIAAAPFVHPKLSVTANINHGLASRLERAITASGKPVVVDAKAQRVPQGQGED